MSGVNKGPRYVKELARAAIVIGIDHDGGAREYGRGIPRLKNAASDALAIAECLQTRHGYNDCTLLTNQSASRDGILSALEGVAQRLSADHQLLFYFAGHGLAREDEKNALHGYLIPAGASNGRDETYLPMSVLRDVFRQVRCRHLLVILDCCFAGSFAKAATRDLLCSSAKPTPTAAYERWIKRRSYQLIVSASHDEMALDRLEVKVKTDSAFPELRCSPFAHAILEGIGSQKLADHNGDGVVTPRELAVHIDSVFSRLEGSHQRSGDARILEQTPHLWTLDWHDGGDYVFLVDEPRLQQPEALTNADNPYRGLHAFQREHRHLFFGRERVAGELAEHVRATRLTTVLGPSGVGKSSLVRAGLLPSVAPDGRAGWTIWGPFRPGVEPLAALAGAIAMASSSPPARASGEPVLLVIDQLEELVTMTRNPVEQAIFLEILGLALMDNLQPEDGGRVLKHCESTTHYNLAKQVLSALMPHRGRLKVLATLRSDYETHLVHALTLKDDPAARDLATTLWAQSRFFIPAMNREELRECIVRPASEYVVFFDSSLGPNGKQLVDTLLDEVENMPGALPLLSMALSEMFLSFLRRAPVERTIGWEDYNEVGGAAQALQRKAEQVYAGPQATSGDQSQSLTRIGSEASLRHTLLRIMLRMVALEGGDLSRRRVSLEELGYADADEQARVDRAIRILLGARLIVGMQTRRTHVDASMRRGKQEYDSYFEPAHDRLVKGWPRLSNLIKRMQPEMILHRSLWDAACAWHASGRKHVHLWNDDRVLRIHELAGFSVETAEGAEGAPRSAAGAAPKGSVRAAMAWWISELISVRFFLDRVPAHTLNRIEQEFIVESLRARRRRRLGVVGAVTMVLGVLGASAIITYLQSERAEEQSLRAEAETTKAEQRLDESRKVARQVATMASKLKYIAGGAKARKALLDSILKLQEELSRQENKFVEQGDAPALHYELGNLEITHGTLEGAEASYKEGCMLAISKLADERLARLDPSRPPPEPRGLERAHHNVAYCYRMLGHIYNRQAKSEEARRHIEESQSTVDAFLKANKDSALLHLDRAANLKELGNITQNRCKPRDAGCFREANRYYEMSIATADKLSTLRPPAASDADPDPAEVLATRIDSAIIRGDSLSWVGYNLMMELNQPLAGKERLEASVSGFTAILETDPGNCEVRKRLALARKLLGNLFWSLATEPSRGGDIPAETLRDARKLARENYEQRRRELHGMMEEDPNNVEWRLDYVESCCDLLERGGGPESVLREEIGTSMKHLETLSVRDNRKFKWLNERACVRGSAAPRRAPVSRRSSR